MNEKTNGNGKINNTQRKVLSTLAVELLDKSIQRARDESGDLVAEIREQVRRELGVDAIEMEIESMETKIGILRKKREELGFGQYKDSIVHGSKAKMLLDQRTSTASQKVKSLEDKKTDMVSKIWTSTTMTEALSLLDEVKGDG
jgi:hypothetical protein